MSLWDDDKARGEDKECKLLSGNFATLLQILLGCIALSVLVIKRVREVPRRPLLVWAFDASKQMIGATVAHVANLVIAIVLYSYEHAIRGSGHETVDQCALYFVNFTLDTTFGVVLNYVFLSVVVLLAHRFHWSALKTPGDYGTPVRVTTWGLQVLSWILVIYVSKILIAVLIMAFQKPMGAFARLLFKPLRDYPDIELALVMVVCPCLMNALQFWIQDSFLKKDIRDESFIIAQVTQSPGHVNPEDKVPILGTPTDEESSESGQDDTNGTVGHDQEETPHVETKTNVPLDVSIA
ncbi:hypothetical protein PsorP6_017115 [Peronosclerospora sorghi]|uniref:Uncharacterized protein n=1 Tax=Peronosclerospora sorghi TaxID=230839 RepID=A0ACC0WGK1_9STRA|nr:hypothetical protein PsorP6_017115 [Peronosclerospora sorghi]